MSLTGLVAALCSGVGYALEWFRQRGTCDGGDASPDTLAVSVLLIVLGGGLVGLVAVALAIVRAVRHGVADAWRSLVLALVAVGSVGPLLLFAGAGPSTWFQYCAT